MARTLEPAKLAALCATLEGHVAKGELPSAQLALAADGELVAEHAWGEVETGAGRQAADPRTLYVAFSTTKTITASATWLLLQDGALDLGARVADLIPGFEANGKGDVRVEHLLTHTCGFPNAPFPPASWPDVAARRARFASWRLETPPGARFVYHRAASFWVLADIISQVSGLDHGAFIRQRIAEPLGLDDLWVGLPEAQHPRLAQVTHFGAAPAAGKVAGVGLDLPDLDESHLESYSSPAVSAIGVPGGGGVTTAGDLALLYQALLGARPGRDGQLVWRRDTLDQALRVRTADLPDPMTGKAANRALGVVIAGDNERPYRSFGFTNSPTAFGHPGLGGQLSWADPATGLSFVFLTQGVDRDPLRMGMRGARLATLAAMCLPPGAST